MIFATEHIKVDYNEKNGAFSISIPGKTYTSDETHPAAYETAYGKNVQFHEARNFIAESLESGFGTGVAVKYFFYDGTILLTSCWIEKSVERLHFETRVLAGESLVKTISWPSPLVMPEAEKGYTVVPVRQGLLIPDNLPFESHPVYEQICSSRDLTFPMFGQVNDGAGYMCIVETPFDGKIDYHHEPMKPTWIHVNWIQCLGKMSGCRQLQYRFYWENCDYNLFCAEYRSYLKECGRYRTLHEKAIRVPNINRLVGAPVIYSEIAYWHCEPESLYYDHEDLSKNDVVITFEEQAKLLETLKNRGLDNAYVHLDGWVKAGYDNQHPDVLPPHHRCGGTEGLAYLKDKCHEMGYLLAYHDQYRDFYMNAESYDPQQATWETDGNLMSNYIWPGGQQAMLCQKIADYYVRRNYEGLKSTGILPDGAYLDVFSATPPDECAHEFHPVSREQGAAYRNGCLEQVRNYGLLASSEEVIDCYVPHLDLVHHTPYYDDIKTLNIGVPLPLVSMVFHACIFIPWPFCDVLPLPSDEVPFLHCLLNGGLPANYTTNISDNKLKQMKFAAKLNADVWDCELVNHSYLTDDYKVQRTVFSNGTAVTVDFLKNTATIEWADGTSDTISALD